MGRNSKVTSNKIASSAVLRAMPLQVKQFWIAIFVGIAKDGTHWVPSHQSRRTAY